MSKTLNTVFPARRMLRRLGLLGALLVLPTAVLAYADLLPESLDMLGFDLGDSPDLPHVARQIAIGAPLKIVAFGSSSTEGVGASTPANAYPARLQIDLRKKLHGMDVAVINRGIGGEHVDDMLARLDRDVIAAEPQLVIWQTGSNDPLRGVSLDHFREATVSAIRRIRDAGIDVVLMEPQWCPKLESTPGASRFRDAVRSIGDELDVPVIRRADLMHGWVREGKLTTKAALRRRRPAHGRPRLRAPGRGRRAVDPAGCRPGAQPRGGRRVGARSRHRLDSAGEAPHLGAIESGAES